MLIQDYWSSFREELIATSLVLVVAVGGSFFILDRLVNPKPTSSETKTEVVLGAETKEVIPEITSVPTPTVTPIPSPTANPYTAEVFYGGGGLYENDQYKLGLNSPKITFDARDSSSRKFVIGVVLTNKTVTQGLQNTIMGTIVKDGVVIVPKAAMSLSETKIVLPGETFSYSAKLSLIEGTDVSVVTFTLPDGMPPIEHILRP